MAFQISGTSRLGRRGRAGRASARQSRVADAITKRAVAGEHSTPIGMDTEITATRPTELSRTDGESVYRVAKAQLYTSPAVLAAEARIVTAAGRTTFLRR